VDPSLECVTVFAGVNDYRLHKPIGQLGNQDIYTFYGAYATTVERVLMANPACRLSLWTPLHRDKDGFDIDMLNEVGHRLGDYAEAVRQIGQRYALPVLDLYAESGINRLTLPLFTNDGLHPNAAGHKRIAAMAVPFLERI
jgi:lysophospholipase L1-like esterase